jgi:hypothetical protein
MMSTGFVLLDQKSAITQCRRQRLVRDAAYRTANPTPAKLSGVVVVHTAENATDFEGVDSGAEAVTRFILTRTTPGCYHRLVDSDSRVALVPWEWETWHETTVNPHAVGISFALRAADWNRLHAQRRYNAILNGVAEAVAFHDYMLKTYNIKVPGRLLSRAESVAGVPGFIGHGMIDVGRRTDPGSTFPWELFFTLYNAATNPVRPPETLSVSKPELMGVTMEEIVTRLFRNILGREPRQEDIDHFTVRYASTGDIRTVHHEIFNSPEAKKRRGV